MKRGLISLSLIFLIVISLVLVSCGSSKTTTTTTTTTSQLLPTQRQLLVRQLLYQLQLHQVLLPLRRLLLLLGTGGTVWAHRFMAALWLITWHKMSQAGIRTWVQLVRADLFLIWKHCLWVIIQLPLLSGTSQHLGYLHNLPPVVWSITIPCRTHTLLFA